MPTYDKEYFDAMFTQQTNARSPVPSEGSSDQSPEQQRTTSAAPAKPTQQPANGTTATNNAATPKPAPVAAQTTTQAVPPKAVTQVLHDLQQQSVRMRKQVDDMAAQINALQNAADDLREQIAKQRQAAKPLSDAVQDAVAQVDTVKGKVEQIGDAVHAVKANFAGLPTAADVRKQFDDYNQQAIEAAAFKSRAINRINTVHARNNVKWLLRWLWVPILALFLVVLLCSFAVPLGKAMGGYCAQHEWPVVVLFITAGIGVLAIVEVIVIALDEHDEKHKYG